MATTIRAGGPFEGVDKLQSAIQYLHWGWGVDTPREAMQANLDARAIMLKLQERILDQLEAQLMKGQK